jgi:tetratricopeptide (TPR) repeat protein
MRTGFAGLLVLTAALGCGPLSGATWHKVETPHFRLFCEAGEGRTREYATALEQFRVATGLVTGIRPTQLPAYNVVIVRSEKALEPYLDVNKDGKRKQLSGQNQSYDQMTVGVTSNEDPEVARRSLFWGGASWVLSGFRQRFPDWLRAGYCEAMATFEFRGSEYTVGRANDYHVVNLNQGGLMSVPEILGIQIESLAFRGDSRTSRYHASAWLFVHYTIFGLERRRGPTGAPRLGEFIELLGSGMDETVAFEEAFALTPEQMGEKLDAYRRGGRYAMAVGKLDRKAIAARIRVLPASPAEVEMAHALAWMTNQEFVQAAGCLARAQTLDPSDPKVLELLGDLYHVQHEEGMAAQAYERSLEIGGNSHRAHFYLANRVFAGYPPAAGSRASPRHFQDAVPKVLPARAREAIEGFKRAVRANPDYLPPYERIAMLMPCVDRGQNEDVRVLQEGLERSPGNRWLLAGVGAWAVKNGQAEVGREQLTILRDAGAGRVPGDVRAFCAELLVEAQGGDHLAAVRKALEDGKPAQAREAVDAVDRSQLTPAQRAELFRLMLTSAARMEILRARELAANGDPAEARRVLEETLASAPDPETADQARAELSALPKA